MERRFQQQSKTERSRGREKVYRAGDRFARILIEGNDQSINGTNTSKIVPDSISGTRSPLEEHSVVFEPRRSSSKKAIGTSIKTLIHEEMSRDKKDRQSSPSVIARLMGLDALPPPQTVAKQQKEVVSSFSKTSYEDHSLGRSTNERQEFKDVFEIKDSRKNEKHKRQSAIKGASRSKQDEAGVAFIKQKFVEAKRLSTDETLQNSKEFDDALEVLDSNKDLFLKFLQEPNSLYSKHLQNLKGSPPAPYESHITILRSMKGKKYEIDEASCKSELKSGRHPQPQVQKDAMNSLPKPTVNLFNQALKEHSGSLSQKLLKSRNAGKHDSSHRTKIVVLKPNLEKAQDMARKVSYPISHDNSPFGYRRHRDFEQSEVRELHAEGKERQNSFENAEILKQRTKGSREISREISTQMKLSVFSDKKLASGFNRTVKDEGLCGPPGMYSLNNSEAYQHTQDNFDNQDIRSSPLSYTTGSTVSTEAKKRLSERWRVSNRHQGTRLDGGVSSTLGEMLAQSDREVTRVFTNTVTAEQNSDEKLARGMLQTQWYPSGISSKDGWKDECSSKLPSSSSLPSSVVCGAPKLSSRRRTSDSDSCYMLKDVLNLGTDDSSHENLKQRGSSRRSLKLHHYKPHFNSGGEENKLPVREIYVNQVEPRDGIHVFGHSEVNPMLSKFFDSMIVNSNNLIDSSPVHESMNVEMPSIDGEEHVEELRQTGDISGNNHVNEIIQDLSVDNPRVDSLPSQCDGSVSESSKGAEQPSPVSVLDPQSEETESSPGCFERVSADLQELRMQLQLLRLESDAYNKECEDLVSSEDDSKNCNHLLQKGMRLQPYRDEEGRDFAYLCDVDSKNCNHLLQKGMRLQPYRDEEHRDFAYLCDVVNNFGVTGSLERSVDTNVFEKLEEKYDILLEWPKLERKLLFDHISSILPEVLGPCMDQHPWVKKLQRNLSVFLGRERLAEEVWRVLVQLRKELSRGKLEQNILDRRWLELGDDVDMIGREIEGMLKEELLEELVSEFILY